MDQTDVQSIGQSNRRFQCSQFFNLDQARSFAKTIPDKTGCQHLVGEDIILARHNDGHAGVVARVAHEDWPDRTVNVTFADPAASVEVFALNGNVSQDFQFNKVTGNVHVGDVVGQAVFYQHNEEVARVDLVACEDVAAPNIFESFGIWWDRLARGFSGQQTVADTTVLNDTPLIYDKQATIIS